MKIALIIVRILMGLMFAFASVTYFLKSFPQPAMHGGVKLFMDGVNATTYLMPLIKATELICAIAFLVGRFVPLAAVVLFPVIVNIVLFHAFLEPAELPLVVALLLGDLFIAYCYRNNYKTLVAAK